MGKKVRVKLNGFYPSFIMLTELHNVRYRTIKPHEEILLLDVNKQELEFAIEYRRLCHLHDDVSITSNHNNSYNFNTNNETIFNSMKELMDKYSIKYEIRQRKCFSFTYYINEIAEDLGFSFHKSIVEVA